MIARCNSHTATATNQEDIELQRDEKRLRIETMKQNIEFQSNLINLCLLIKLIICLKRNSYLFWYDFFVQQTYFNTF